MISDSYLHSLINFHCQLRSSELMLLGFISLLLTATSSMIANICIPSKFYDSTFAPCTKSQIEEEMENKSTYDRKLLMVSALPHLFRRMLNNLDQNTCGKACHLSLRSNQTISINACIHTRVRTCVCACMNICISYVYICKICE